MKTAKQMICIGILIGLILTIIPGAGAETTSRRGLVLRREVHQPRRGLPYLGHTERITCEESSWTLSEEAANTGISFIYVIGALDGTNPTKPDGTLVADTLYQSQETEATTFTYTFYETGDYVLFVDSIDSAGGVQTLWYTINVTAGTGTNHLLNKAAEVAALCQRSSDFATALAINDWLCASVSYDYSLTYYSADSALLLGTGVCNSYTRAFELIAKACGLDVYRACGTSRNQGHTWNTVKMDGNWYHIDVTWNDSGSLSRYCWFGLTDSLIDYDHTFEHYAQEKTCICSHMEDNYYVHENKLEEYLFCFSDERGMVFETYPQNIQKSLNSGSTYYEQEALTDVWTAGNGTQYHTIENLNWPLLRAVIQKTLSKHIFTMQNEPVRVLIETTDDDLIVRVTGWDLEESGTMVLPEDVETIETGAFEYTGATTVTINEGCTGIRSRVFANSAVRTIHIPDSVLEIERDAFAECGPIIIIAAAGTEAADFAEGNGIIWLEP